jgi:hypothetical protein
MYYVELSSCNPISSDRVFLHYKIFGQIQHRKIVANDPKMVAIVLFLQFFWLNVVALVTVAIGECNGLRFSCDTRSLYCNSFDAFATHGECCNKSNCKPMGVAIVSIATNKALLAIRIATCWSCSNIMQLQRNTCVAIMVIATRRKHCNRASLSPRHLNGFYRWLRLLKCIRRLVATERSSIATFVNGCYRRHRLLPHYLGWLLHIGHLLPRY